MTHKSFETYRRTKKNTENIYNIERHRKNKEKHNDVLIQTCRKKQTNKTKKNKKNLINYREKKKNTEDNNKFEKQKKHKDEHIYKSKKTVEDTEQTLGSTE